MTLQAHHGLRGVYPAFSADVPRLEALASEINLPSARFVLFVAANTSGIDSPKLVTIAETILKRGATYVCCWGPDCERLHDCFDEADVYHALDDDEAPVVMTTWHGDESLEEAAWFALHTASPHPGLEEGTNAVLLATVGNPDWAARLAHFLSTGAAAPE